MDEREVLAQQFEEHRRRLRHVAYRMLGSLSDADDALQEAWLRLNRSDAGSIGNLSGWLTTVVAHVCLDMLRSRVRRREESLAGATPEPRSPAIHTADPEEEALMADSVGLALLVVLDRLAPAERLAFVLHDVFAMPFEEIAPLVGRSAEAARQLASRARRRVQGCAIPSEELMGQRKVVDAFVEALRAGDFDGLVAVLDPELVVHADLGAGGAPGPVEVHGAEVWARQAMAFAKGAIYARLAMVDGSIGAILAPRGHLTRALLFSFADGRISRIEVIANSERLEKLDLAMVPWP